MVVIFVLGSIYGGIASVTEASAVGVVGVLLSTVIRGEFNKTLLLGAIRQTLATVGMIVWIGIGASALVGVFNLMGGHTVCLGSYSGRIERTDCDHPLHDGHSVPAWYVLDWVGIALLCMPIFVPIVKDLGYDPVCLASSSP